LRRSIICPQQCRKKPGHAKNEYHRIDYAGYYKSFFSRNCAGSGR
jgi:hypothetical protein